ncbi:MAG: hypothetical protein JW741_04270 [Sedimentisphaerales bacterium]|nr:hypothetical protein [Sedimentisphaerales bacterium]
MCTRISVAIAVVLLVCSVVGAQTVLPGSAWQFQDFNVGNLMNPGISSVLNTVHGSGAYAHAFTDLDICNSQSTPVCIGPVGIIGLPGQICQASCLTAAGQCQDGYLAQTAEADGDCAIIGVNAFLDAGGAQEQTIGASVSPKSQGQSLGMAADQVLLRSDGGGTGWAINEANLYQSQSGKNAAGSVLESSGITGYQNGVVNGNAGSTATLATSMNACTTQAQVVY